LAKEAGVDYELFIVRSVRLASTVMACGATFVQGFVIEPAFRGPSGGPQQAVFSTAAAALRRRLRQILRISLLIAVISGAAWCFVTVASISDRPLNAVFSDDVAWKVLTATQFGQDWLVRLGDEDCMRW
jgi:hypothetical protein